MPTSSTSLSAPLAKSKPKRRISCSWITAQVAARFPNYYPHFRDFQQDPVYQPFRQLFWGTVSNCRLFFYTLNSNDNQTIVPVELFALYHQTTLEALAQSMSTQTYQRANQGIGALYGMVFLHILGYTNKYSVKFPTGRRCPPLIHSATGYTNPPYFFIPY